jgi:hypothetical protein
MSGKTTTPTLAFFGATGGCAGSALADALKSGYTAKALVRTPSKLTTTLQETWGVPASAIDAHLTIVQGAVSDTSAVRETLLINGSIADRILYGIGGTPIFNNSLITPFSISDPQVCATGMRAVIDAADALTQSGKKPMLLVVSTTGISRLQRDVPLYWLWFYRWCLPIMHKDKRVTEDLVAEATEGLPGDGKKPFAHTVVVRPTHLVDGASKGMDSIRTGWEGMVEQLPGEPGPEMGFAISRADVGLWMFEELIARDPTAQWAGKAVTLTT